LEALSRGSSGGLAGRFPFKKPADGVEFANLTQIEGGDESALAGADFNEAFAFKAKDGFADRGATEFERVDVFVDRDGVTGGERVGEDLAFEFAIGEIGRREGGGGDGSLFF